MGGLAWIRPAELDPRQRQQARQQRISERRHRVTAAMGLQPVGGQPQRRFKTSHEGYRFGAGTQSPLLSAATDAGLQGHALLHHEGADSAGALDLVGREAEQIHR